MRAEEVHLLRVVACLPTTVPRDSAPLPSDRDSHVLVKGVWPQQPMITRPHADGVDRVRYFSCRQRYFARRARLAEGRQCFRDRFFRHLRVLAGARFAFSLAGDIAKRK